MSAGDAGQPGGVLIEHRGNTPRVDPSAYVAPTAVLCGAVQVGPEARILFGAVLTAEDGEISVGARCVVMENALLRGRARHPCVLGDDVLVGPHAHVNGARVGDGCFLATGAALFPGCVLGEGTEVRIHGVVHVNTVLPPGATVPIGWVAVGDPAEILPPGGTSRSGPSRSRWISPAPSTASPAAPRPGNGCRGRPPGTPPTSATARPADLGHYLTFG